VRVLLTSPRTEDRTSLTFDDFLGVLQKVRCDCAIALPPADRRLLQAAVRKYAAQPTPEHALSLLVASDILPRATRRVRLPLWLPPRV
jgi:hypothetical protein